MDELATELATEWTATEELTPESSIFGQTETENQPLETEAPVFDWSSHTDQLVTVKVDGEELQVPLGEAINGYQRQADYTRKTQSLSEQQNELEYAQSLQTALENDPEGTVEYLARVYGVDLAQNTAAEDIEPEYFTPEEQRIADLEKRVMQQETVRQEEAVLQEIIQLQDRYGEFDETALLSYAIKHQIPSLDMAYTHMMFPQVQQGAKAYEEAMSKYEAQKLEAESKATQAKRAAAGVVSPGHGTSSSAVGVNTPEVMSLRQAFSQAVQQHGS